MAAAMASAWHDSNQHGGSKWRKVAYQQRNHQLAMAAWRSISMAAAMAA